MRRLIRWMLFVPVGVAVVIYVCISEALITLENAIDWTYRE